MPGCPCVKTPCATHPLQATARPCLYDAVQKRIDARLAANDFDRADELQEILRAMRQKLPTAAGGDGWAMTRAALRHSTGR